MMGFAESRDRKFVKVYVQQKKSKPYGVIGSRGRGRTYDKLINSQLLYH